MNIEWCEGCSPDNCSGGCKLDEDLPEQSIVDGRVSTMKDEVWITGFKAAPDDVSYYCVTEFIEPYDEEEEIASKYTSEAKHKEDLLALEGTLKCKHLIEVIKLGKEIEQVNKDHNLKYIDLQNRYLELFNDMSKKVEQAREETRQQCADAYQDTLNCYEAPNYEQCHSAILNAGWGTNIIYCGFCGESILDNQCKVTFLERGRAINAHRSCRDSLKKQIFDTSNEELIEKLNTLRADETDDFEGVANAYNQAIDDIIKTIRNSGLDKGGL